MKQFVLIFKQIMVQASVLQASSCELLDSCDHNGHCTSNISICIVNCCCTQPVCLPLILIDLCSSYGAVTKENEF